MQLDLFTKDTQDETEREVHELYCPKCKEMKTLDNFDKCVIAYETEPRPTLGASISGTARWCKSCRKEYQRGKNIAAKKATPKPLEPSPCECCGTITEPNKLHLDHDHGTYEFRGWVCRKCNVGLGALGDNIEGLEQAIKYLKRHK